MEPEGSCSQEPATGPYPELDKSSHRAIFSNLILFHLRFQRTTCSYIPEDTTLHKHRRENLKSYICVLDRTTAAIYVGNHPGQNVIMARGYEAACHMPLLSSLCLLYNEPQITNIHRQLAMLTSRLPDVTHHPHASSVYRPYCFYLMWVSVRYKVACVFPRNI
jgi:hypothetical protein